MKGDTLTSLNRRYIDAESGCPLVPAIILDPQSNDKFFNGLQNEPCTSSAGVLLQSVKNGDVECFSEMLGEAGVEVDSFYNPVVDKNLSELLILFHRGNAGK